MKSKNNKGEKDKFVIQECVKKLKTEKLPPWKVEDEIAAGYGITPPDNYRVAALCRQKFIEEETGEKFFNKVFY
ncbi:MAG: hypothetical protein WBC02_11630 [Candidatus Aminicenantaceae bacterium]